MINLTNGVQIIKDDKDLSSAVIKAIQDAKQCVVDHYLGEKSAWPSPDQVTAGGRNRFKRLTIVKLFHQHDDSAVAPDYDSAWIKDLYSAALKSPTAEQVTRLIPRNSRLGPADINKHFRDHFKNDALLILHFLWFERAVLLPFTLSRPTAKDEQTGGNDFEYAANHYPETLALVRYPFLRNIRRNLVHLTDFLPSSAHSNFNWLAWRLIRATDWYVVEDINVDDVARYFEEYTEARRKAEYIPDYSFSPKALLACFKEAFPNRCQFSMDDPRLINTRRLATEHAIGTGSFHVPKSLEEHKEKWILYEQKFLKRLKSRGIHGWKKQRQKLGVLNAYLLDELPLKVGAECVPMPSEFSRKYLEDFEGIPSLIDYVREGRQPGTVNGILGTINQFMDYLESCSNTYEELENFRNPIRPDLDFPIFKGGNSTSKAVFSSEHFVPLLQFCYAIEAFGFFLAEKIVGLEKVAIRRHNNISDAFNPVYKVYDTQALGFVPIVFTKNPEFVEDKPTSEDNRRIIATPLLYIAKTILPMHARRLKNRPGLTSVPTLNYVQQTIVALETGIRNVHIRWLDRRTYDKNIDRSKELPPICNLWVPTDKAHGEWGAKVSRSVIEVLDRQKKSHEWFDEPEINEEASYNYYDSDNRFGKILTIFPAGLISGINSITPGPLTEGACAQRFKWIVFAFDLFCRFSTDVNPSNKMPEELRSIEAIDTLESYSDALKFYSEYQKSLEHTPHSCRASVVSHWITLLPPHIIGDYITGHSTTEHVLYYVKLDPDYLKRHQQFQKLAFDNGFTWDESNISSIKAESIDSKLHEAFKKNKEGAIYDFGAMSYDRVTKKGEVLSGVKVLKKQPLEAITFHGTHICPFADHCPKDVVEDLKAIPGVRMPCGGCYYSVKTVDHLPRISGHVRSLIEESAELKEYIDDARKGGADPLTFKQKAEHRQFLADEIAAWTVTMHCLDQMYQNIQGRDHFLVQQPEIVSEQLQQVVVDGSGVEYLLARLAEAKRHAEFFTPRLKSQTKLARAKILKLSGEYHRLLQDEPSGFTLLDEFRGIVRAACETCINEFRGLSGASQADFWCGD